MAGAVGGEANTMATCIYCRNETGNREHWIPRGLETFRGYTPLLGQVCGTCNNRLGQLDQELLRTGPTGFYRALHGVQGRHGRSRVSPFHYKALRADQPTRMMMPALGREHQVLAEAYRDEEGRSSARPIRQVVLRMPDERMECVPFPRCWAAEQLRTAVSNRGLEAGSLEEVYLEDDEVFTGQEAPHALEIRTLLSSVFGRGFAAEVYGGSGERTQDRLAMVAGINTIYLRAVAKVAFHYFLWACPVLRGSDPAFREIRAFISDGTGNWRDVVELDAPQFLPVLQRGCVPERTSHFFHSVLTRSEARAFVQFFVGPSALPPPARVLLAESPLMVEGRDFACHQACYYDDDAEKADGHDGELVTISTWERRVIAPQ